MHFSLFSCLRMKLETWAKTKPSNIIIVWEKFAKNPSNMLHSVQHWLVTISCYDYGVGPPWSMSTTPPLNPFTVNTRTCTSINDHVLSNQIAFTVLCIYKSLFLHAYHCQKYTCVYQVCNVPCFIEAFIPEKLLARVYFMWMCLLGNEDSTEM